MLSLAGNRVSTVADLAGRSVAVIEGTTSASALETRLENDLINADVVVVQDRAQGMDQLRDGEVDAFASDQIVLLGEAMEAVSSGSNVSYSFADELYSFEPYAMMVQRDDADFRLVANRAIAQLYRGGQFAQLYQTWVGSAGITPSAMLMGMYQIQSLTE